MEHFGHCPTLNHLLPPSLDSFYFTAGTEFLSLRSLVGPACSGAGHPSDVPALGNLVEPPGGNNLSKTIT